MPKSFEILSDTLLEAFEQAINFDPLENVIIKSKEAIPFDNFSFYTSVSSVYSSKIEGVDIEADSYIKHKFLKVKYEPDYTKKADDLYAAYEFAQHKKLNGKNVLKAHKLLSQNLLAANQRGVIRWNPMFVLNEADRIEYIACEPSKVKQEWKKLFKDMKQLRKTDLSTIEIFYYAAFIHLVFLKIHPLQDGNGRTARLIEKWFLREKLGQKAIAIELEKNYYKQKKKYYDNIRATGLDYETLNYEKGLAFLLMTVGSLADLK